MSGAVRIVAVLEDLQPQALVEIDGELFLVAEGALGRAVPRQRLAALIAKHGWTPMELEAPTVERAIAMVATYAVDPAELLR